MGSGVRPVPEAPVDPAFAAEYEAAKQRVAQGAAFGNRVGMPKGPAAHPDDVDPAFAAEYAAAQQRAAAQKAKTPRAWGAAESAINGFTMGFAPKLAAGLDAAAEQVGLGGNGQHRSFHDAYVADRDAYGAGRDQFAQDHPWQSGIANVAGGVAGMLVGGVAGAGVKAAALAGELGPGAGLVARGLAAGRTAAAPVAGGLATRIMVNAGRAAKAGAVGGAGFGAAQGAGEATGGPVDYATRMLKGGAMGAAAGTVLAPTLGPLASKVAGPLADIAGRFGLTGEEGVANSSAALLYRRLTQGGQAPDALAGAYQAGTHAPTAPIVETGGPRVANLARDVRTVGGEGATTVERAMNMMRDGQHQRIGDAFHSAFGVQGVPNVMAHADALIGQRAAEAGPAFEAAYREPADLNGLRGDMRTPWGRLAWNHARDLMEQDGHRVATQRVPVDVNPPDALPTPQNEWATQTRYEPVLGIREGHYFRQAIDNMLRNPQEFRLKAPDGGTTGTANNVQRVLQDMRGRVTGELHGASDAFAHADRTYADQSQMLNGFGLGQQMLSTPRDAVAHEFPRQAPPVQEQYRLGAAAQIDNRLAMIPDTRDAVPAVWGNKAARDKLQAVLPSGNYGPLDQAMQQEGTRSNLFRTVMAGSQTADKAIGAADVMGEIDPTVVSTMAAAAHGHPGAIMALVAKAAARAQTLRVGEQRGAWLGQRLVSDDPQAVLAEVIRRMAARQPGLQTGGAAVTGAGSAAGVARSGPGSSGSAVADGRLRSSSPAVLPAETVSPGYGSPEWVRRDSLVSGHPRAALLGGPDGQLLTRMMGRPPAGVGDVSDLKEPESTAGVYENGRMYLGPTPTLNTVAHELAHQHWDNASPQHRRDFEAAMGGRRPDGFTEPGGQYNGRMTEAHAYATGAAYDFLKAYETAPHDPQTLAAVGAQADSAEARQPGFKYALKELLEYPAFNRHPLRATLGPQPGEAGLGTYYDAGWQHASQTDLLDARHARLERERTRARLPLPPPAP